MRIGKSKIRTLKKSEWLLPTSPNDACKSKPVIARKPAKARLGM